MVDNAYTNTQNVRRFMARQCGSDFTFNRALVAWIQSGSSKSMGDVADEWLRQQQAKWESKNKV